MPYPMTGSCQCGRVEYELRQPPLAIAACHCRQCQKLSTSAFSISAMVSADDLTVTGELAEWSRVADSGETVVARFCPVCGNHIYHYNPDKPQHRMLKPSTLSDTDIINPAIHVWISEKQDWFQIPEGVACHETQP